MIFHVIFPPEKSIRQKWGRGDPFFIKIKYNCVVPYASESVTANIHRPSHLFFYGRHSTFILNKKVLCEKFYFFLDFFGNKCTLFFICPHRNDGLYDFVLFVLYSKQEIPKRAVQHRKFWCFNVPVVYFNLLFLLLFGTFWRTLGRSHTWSKIRQDLCQVKVESLVRRWTRRLR